jgi:predicted ferric reductase
VWLWAYLLLVTSPLLVLLAPGTSGLGFLWTFAVALGFGGLGLMCVQFFLTARLHRATAPFGIDAVFYFHRYLGVVALVLIIAHPALLIVDNPAVADFVNPLSAPPHMAAGTLAIVAALILVAVSFGRKQIRLPYEVWRMTHVLLAVAVVALALGHIGGVQYYVSAPLTRALWMAIVLSLAATLLYVRIVRPWRLLRRPYRVVDVARERGDAWTLSLAPVGHDGFAFGPGQFAWLTIGGSPFLMNDHPFSFSSSPSRPGGGLTFTIKELGDFTRTLGKVERGTRAFVDGPYGAMTLDRQDAPGYVFIAGGIGIAPIMSMLRALADRGDLRPLVLFYAYRLWERMTCREAIDQLAAELHLHVVYVLEEPPVGWAGERGRITRDVLDRHLPPGRERLTYFVCGPDLMTQAMERHLRDLGVPASRVHSELFDLV